MPSSKNYDRDYAHEDAIESPRRRQDRAKRDAARRAFIKASGPIAPGFDVDHIKPLSKGGSNRRTNLQLQKSGPNRSYPRTPSGRMKTKYD